VEIDIAKMLGADMAFSKNGDAVTVIYATSDLGAQRLFELGLRSLGSAVSSPSYFIFTPIEKAVDFLKKTYDLELEQVTTQKTSQ